MKPWLFDILACPLDKHFPLKLYIFSFEIKTEDFNTFLEIFEERDLDAIKKEEIIEIMQEDGNIYIKDNIIIEKTALKEYINLILLSIDELDNIFDKTSNKLSNKSFRLIQSVVKPKIIEFSQNLNSTNLINFLPELYLLNKIKLEVEIESGLLFCEECNRWYPIIDTIPQMLPDEFRNKEKELEFLQTNKDLLDEEFFNQDLKPFGI
ncbi:MAG: Trm112 family protein [Promethearchaeota archaeon]